MSLSDLPRRAGRQPRTTPTNPHTQLDQNASAGMVAQLAQRAFELPGVEERPSMISVPGARALWLSWDGPAREGVFMIGREFAHIHPLPDGSLHMVLPPADAEAAIEKGWAEVHPVARLGIIPPNVVMVYGPRDAEELEVVLRLLRSSHAAAAALPADTPSGGRGRRNE